MRSGPALPSPLTTSRLVHRWTIPHAVSMRDRAICSMAYHHSNKSESSMTKPSSCRIEPRQMPTLDRALQFVISRSFWEHRVPLLTVRSHAASSSGSLPTDLPMSRNSCHPHSQGSVSAPALQGQTISWRRGLHSMPLANRAHSSYPSQTGTLPRSSPARTSADSHFRPRSGWG